MKGMQQSGGPRVCPVDATMIMAMIAEMHWIHIPSDDSHEQGQHWPGRLQCSMVQPHGAWLASVGGTLAAPLLVLPNAPRMGHAIVRYEVRKYYQSI